MTKQYQFISILILSILISSCSSTKNRLGKADKKNTFSDEEIALIMQGDSLSPMRVFQINNKSDSILLSTKSSAVNLESNPITLKRVVERMYHTVRDSLSAGVGIAAPQVGILKQIIWIQRFDKEGAPFECYLNPRIIQYSRKKQEYREGCLSVPDRMDTLNSRSYAILIEYDKLDQTHHIEMIEDFTAVIFQHEIDHLNGILYLQYLDGVLREESLK